MQDRVVAIAADYADALLVVRRAKRLLLLLLMLALLGQLAIFCVAQFTDVLKSGPAVPIASSAHTELSSVVMPPTTDPVTGRVTTLGSSTLMAKEVPSPAVLTALTYATFATLSAGMIFGILLSLTLFLTVHIMLVGRLIGVAYVTRAFVLSLLLALLMFPWQSVLATLGLRDGTDLVLPGVLYSWNEIAGHVPMTPSDTTHQILYWGRFLVWPIVALIVLLLIQVRSGKGLKLALGEEELLPLDVGPDGRTIVR